MLNQPHEGYCVKCRSKREIKDAKDVEMPAKGGKTRPAVKGVCPVCGTGMFKMLSSKPKVTPPEAPAVPQEQPKA